MPENIGAQIVTIIYRTPANSPLVNKRSKGITLTGIYSGGYLTKVPATNNANLSPLICEIGDGSHQVRVETLEIVTPIPVVETTKEYIILRWLYTGSTSDFMEILAVAAGEILTTDLVVGRCTFVGGSLNDFTYGDSVHPRTTPNTQDLFLKVEPTGKTGLLVRVRAGRIQTAGGYVNIPDYEISLGTAPSANKKIYLVYVTAAGAIAIDSSGAEAANPVAPTYKGKLVLAEVTLSTGDAIVTVDEIRDVRNWITQPAVPDGTTLELDSDGKFSIKDGGVTEALLGTALSASLARTFGALSSQDSAGSTLAITNVYKAPTDGFLIVVQAGGPNVQVLVGVANPPTIIAGHHTWSSSTTHGQICVPVKKDYFVKITGNIAGSPPILWQPIGTGNLVKQ